MKFYFEQKELIIIYIFYLYIIHFDIIFHESCITIINKL